MAEFLRPGDTVVVGQAAAEPRELVAHLIEATQDIDGVTAVVGYALTDAWAKVTPEHPKVLTYSAHGPMRRLAREGLLEILPCHYSQLGHLVTTGPLKADVVLVQLSPADADGYHSFGTSLDYVAQAAQSSPVIIAEINENMPFTRASLRLHSSRITASITTDRPLAGTPAREPTSTDHAVARKVASVIPDGASVQLGIGAMASAIAAALRGHRGLRVRSGLVGNWLLDLRAAGALDTAEGSCVAGMALGDAQLYAFVQDARAIEFMPITDLVSAAAVARCDPYVAVNSALEVDLLGQVNSEMINGAYIGAVGSQVDTFRATRAAKSGLAVVAVPARNPAGTSQIVGSLSGPVTSPQSDVDLVITEYGIADIRGTSLRERAERLIAVAAPEHRDALRTRLPYEPDREESKNNVAQR
ncbi:acetyl-CoA hydrolase/transferase family protein [Nocardia sp. JW2]|uniref:acetyl-CoA hydrolase/transferase family protein n=1 Tax=Nocardia sp. JW2 TaxID=3450738 RepID=UPI003F43AF16